VREWLATLLRQHGALSDLPQLDRIELRRPSINYSSTPVSKGTNDYNRFSLLELLAVHYGFVSATREPNRAFNWSHFYLQGSLAFPNLETVLIRRPTPDGRARKEIKVDLEAILRSGDCSRDVPLEWGDVVEIPEADHPIAIAWNGFSEEEMKTLQKCVRRQVQVSVKGQTTNLVLEALGSVSNIPVAAGNDPSTGKPIRAVNVPSFTLLPVLNTSGLLRASSDLSRVKVTHHDPVTGKASELVLDCSPGKPAPDLWLRDGDKIEVPEKP